MCLTLFLSVLVLFSESKISSCHIINSVNSSVQHYNLSSQLKSNDLVMWPCQHYVSDHKKCWMSKDLDKCVSYVKSDHQCDLVISHMKWDYVQWEWNYIHSKL